MLFTDSSTTSPRCLPRLGTAVCRSSPRTPSSARHRRPWALVVRPELRDAAYALQDNTVALRLAALWTASSALLYLCGLLLGVAVWVAYQAWPPRRDAAFIGRCLIVIGILIVTGAVGWPATSVAEKRVTELTYESPADEVHFSCGSWILDQPTTVSQQRNRQRPW